MQDTTNARPTPVQRTVHSDPTPEDLDRLPAELKARRQWVLWRGADRIDQQTGELRLNKIPIDPQTLRKADTTDATTWGTFGQCIAALPVALEEWEQDNPSAYRGGGIGFVFSSDDPYAGVDLDHCRDPATGQIAAWAQVHIDTLASYSEVSPSQTGVKVWVKGTLPPHGRKKGNVEMYDYARFFTMTGWHLPDTLPTIADRQQALTTVHTTVFGTPRKTRQPTSTTPRIEDVALLEKARAAKNGAKFAQLWDGDTSLHAGDDSGADLALCIMLAFWTQDAAQLDRLFRQSDLMRTKWDEQRGVQTYGERTIREALARQTEHYRPRQRHVQDAQRRRNGATDIPEAQSGEEPPLPLSDYTNALAFVRNHGQDLRYCYPWKAWLVWTGTHWQRDTSGGVMRRAKHTVKRLARHVEDLDDAHATALMAHIKASLSTTKLKALVECAQSEPGIPVQPEELDTNHWLLNCRNGTLDLRTGKLRPHDRADLLTVVLPVPYEPLAACPIWHAFLDRIMAGNHNLIGFLQRAIGYALTGVIREHVLLILWGTGRNGKSTFLNILRTLLAAYAMKAPSELLMVSNNDRHPTERADLFGKRFVAAIETEQGRRLAEVFVKEVTGGDPIRARRMREDFWEFQPTHKVFLATNHKPVITGTDTAIWERIQLVPFAVTIPPDERDTTLPEKLEHELPGILTWAVQGCLAWQRDGLGEPDEVQQATKGYRTEMDVLGQFITECCLVGADYRVKADKLYDAYKLWHGDQAQNQRAWGMALTERGFERYTNNGTWYRGIGIREWTEHTTEGTEPTEGKNGINRHSYTTREQTRKSGSVPSVPSVNSSTAAAGDYDEGVI
jgi:putative DNA primase/helicase